MKSKAVLQSVGQLGGDIGENWLDRVQLRRAGRQVKMANRFAFEELSYRLLAVHVYIIQQNSAALMLKIYLINKLSDFIGEEYMIFEFPMQDRPLPRNPQNEMHSLLFFVNHPVKEYLIDVDDEFGIALQELPRKCVSILDSQLERVELVPSLSIHFRLPSQREFSLAVADVPQASRNDVNGDLLLEVFGKHRSNFRLVNLRILLVDLDQLCLDHSNLAVLLATYKWVVPLRIQRIGSHLLIAFRSLVGLIWKLNIAQWEIHSLIMYHGLRSFPNILACCLKLFEFPDVSVQS